jgi:monovalent cation/hydrogen antiporter
MRALIFEEKLRLAALNGARKELHQLRRKGEINNTTMITVMNRLDLPHISLLEESKKSFQN